jgi:hypothetical protein
MFELFIWCLVIIAIFKVLRFFGRFFRPVAKDDDAYGQNTRHESKYKDVEEVDFIEIKSDKKDGKDQE